MGLIVKDEVLVSRQEMISNGLNSRYHSAHILSYNIIVNALEFEHYYWLTSHDELSIRIRIKNNDSRERIVKLLIINHANRKERSCEKDEKYHLPETSWTLNIQKSPESIFISNSHEGLKKKVIAGNETKGEKLTFTDGEIWVAEIFQLKVESEKSLEITGLMTRGNNKPVFSSQTSERIEDSYKYYLQSDQEFYESFPYLTGDWPEYWQHSWIYDFETTRMCTLPPTGIFQDYWPTWMITWPRVVLAEGVMDMNRLGYADMGLAKRAILTMFRDSPMDNVPCVFSSGEYNMVAKDGSKCGTSPAWCLPFYNIYELYLRDLDKEWLHQLYPYLKRYLEWWLENRTDEEGWLVYKCTWEAGEDNNPRLDPEGTGDNVVSGNVRPVELQAVMAYSAYIMKTFCWELKMEEDVSYWTKLEREYTKKLQKLWDSEMGRFRDWDKKIDDFMVPVGNKDYWGADFIRYSPLSLSSVLYEIANPKQKEMMKDEVQLYGRVPFIIWPSWTFTVLEAAINLDMYRFASQTAIKIIERVYRENDRRDISDTSLPLPGSAREYWPLEIKEFKGNDAYAWGAQTSLLLIRQIFGFRSSGNTTDIEFVLSPSLPVDLMNYGRQFGLENLYYRGERLTISYRFIDEENLKTILILKEAKKCKVFSLDRSLIYEGEKKLAHTFNLNNFSKCRIRLY